MSSSREKIGITYAEYKNLPLMEHYSVYGEFCSYNRKIVADKNFIASGGKIWQATEEELEEWNYRSMKEKKHREISEKCGGIGNCGYVRLHDRHW